MEGSAFTGAGCAARGEGGGVCGGGGGCSSLLCAGSGDGVSRGGCWRRGLRTEASAAGGGVEVCWLPPCCESVFETSGGGLVGWHCRLGSWVSRTVLWVVSVCVVLVIWPPAGRGVEVGGGCLGFWLRFRFVGGWHVPMGSARRQGLRLRGP